MRPSRERMRQNAQDHEFERELLPTQRSPEHLEIDELRDIRLSVTADLGKCRLRVRDILSLKRGSVLTLDRLAGEMADIQVNGVTLAKGEVVVLGDALHVRVAEMHGIAEKELNFHE